MTDPTDSLLTDPLKLIGLCWPHVKLYDKQRQIIESVERNKVTVVPAGNMLGKDFIAGLIALTFFLSRSPCRVVSSSVDSDQLKGVLWGEMRRFIAESHYELPLLVNDQLIRRVMPDGSLEPRSMILGRVAKKGEGMLGRHIELQADMRPRTLMIFDEGSGIEDLAFNTAATWAHRILVIGNPFECQNFFRRMVKEGDIKADDGDYYYQKIIHICAEDSPNVKPTFAGDSREIPIVIPGLIDQATYRMRRKLWDPVMQCVSLDGRFYEGAEVLMFPPQWLNRAESLATMPRAEREQRYRALVGTAPGRRTMGVDTAEGGDNTVWTICDVLGVLDQEVERTSDTSKIPGRTKRLAKKWNIKPEDILFDRGGGGKVHADLLRMQGWDVRTVSFGKVKPDTGKYPIFTPHDAEKKREEDERRITFKNRRVEMYYLLRTVMDPFTPEQDEYSSPEDNMTEAVFRAIFGTSAKKLGWYPGLGFAIPAKYTELRRQLAPLPLLYDPDGNIYLPPKDKPAGSTLKMVTIRQMLGCSPDESDSLVLAVFGLFNKTVKRILGVPF